jgi:hypothetical protein
MFNRRSKLMERLRIPAFCLILALAIATRGVDGQVSTTVAQNSPQLTVNARSHASSVHPNTPVSQNFVRGPVSIGPRTINSSYASRVAGQYAMNVGSGYSPLMRPLNPTLPAMSARRAALTYNVQSNTSMLPRSEMAQSAPAITSARRVAEAYNGQRTTDILARRQVAQNGLGTTNTKNVETLQPIASDLTAHETLQSESRHNLQGKSNRLSYCDALRSNRREWHNCNWWRQHFTTIVLVNSGYYYLNAGYWYPALGYDPLSSYYDYDGPIYTYGNLLPDEVIANVQVALQDAGYYGGAITGSLNVETRAALANYQRDQGLLITGAIDEPTVQTLGLY